LAELFGSLVGWLVGWSSHGKLDVVNLNSITIANFFFCHQVVSKYKKSEEHIVFFFSFVILPAFCFDLTFL